PEVWVTAAQALAGKTTKGGVKGVPQVKSHFRNLKTMFNEVHDLVNMSGFGWDQEKKCVTASEEVWDELLKTASKYKKWKNRSFDNYDCLEGICIRSTATGEFARDDGDEGRDDDGASSSSDDEDTVLPSKKRKRPSAVSAMAQIAEALNAFASAGADEGVSNVFELILELDGDEFDVDELSTIGALIAEKPAHAAAYRAFKTRDDLRRVFLRKLLRSS
ncbi:hypothetical protein OC842_006162, partial [Tilletia horrida]